MSLENIGLRTKLLIGVGIPIVLIIFLGYIVVSSLGAIRETEKWVTHTHQVLDDAHQIAALTIDMETGMRGYLLAGKDVFLAPYNSGKKKSAELIKSLKKTVSDNPAQVQRLEKLEIVVNNWETKVAEVNISLRRKIAGSLSTTDLARKVAEAGGKKFFDRFREQISIFIANELVLLDKRQKEVSENQGATTTAHSINRVTHTYEAISKAKDVLTAALDMETGERGFLLAGREEFLEPYNSGSTVFYQRASELARFVADNPAQTQLINEAIKTIKDWQRTIVDPLITLRRQIGDAKNMDDLGKLVGEARGKTYFDSFRSLIAEFVAIEEGLLASRSSENEKLVNRTNLIILISILVAVVISLTASYVISNIVLRQVGGEPNRIAVITDRIADGDLTVQFDANRASTGILGAVREMVGSIRKITNQISGATTNVSSALSEIAASISTQTTGAAQQATAINETTSTLEEIRSTSTQTLEKAEMLGGVASKARDQGQQGIQATNQTVEAMSAIRKKVEAIAETNLALSEQTKQIGEITGVVNNLSQQSKMLALNASIEAAKAGEAGKGFAVVASQIGNLAERSEESTVQVQKILENIRHATDRAVMATEEGAKEVDQGVNLVSQTGDTMNSLNNAIRETSVASDQIVAAVRQEAAGIQQIATAMSEIEKVTMQFVSGAEQTEQAIEDLEVVVGDLDASVKFYKLS
jgi:methyl-accepting chemotaxis protein